jgi:hypothetical protein
MKWRRKNILYVYILVMLGKAVKFDSLDLHLKIPSNINITVDVICLEYSEKDVAVFCFYSEILSSQWKNDSNRKIEMRADDLIEASRTVHQMILLTPPTPIVE